MLSDYYSKEDALCLTCTRCIAEINEGETTATVYGCKLKCKPHLDEDEYDTICEEYRNADDEEYYYGGYKRGI